MFITAAPTLVPSQSPETSIPTVSPSFIGLVVSVDITRPATSALDDTEVSELEAIVAQAYGVNPEDLSSIVEYTTTGTMTIDIDPSLSEEDAIASLTTAVSDALGVDEDDVTVSLDPVTGEVTYTVTTEDYDVANGLLETLQSDEIADTINDSTEGISITSVLPK